MLRHAVEVFKTFGRFLPLLHSFATGVVGGLGPPSSLNIPDFTRLRSQASDRIKSSAQALASPHVTFYSFIGECRYFPANPDHFLAKPLLNPVCGPRASRHPWRWFWPMSRAARPTPQRQRPATVVFPGKRFFSPMR